MRLYHRILRELRVAKILRRKIVMDEFDNRSDDESDDESESNVEGRAEN